MCFPTMQSTILVTAIIAPKTIYNGSCRVYMRICFQSEWPVRLLMAPMGRPALVPATVFHDLAMTMAWGLLLWVEGGSETHGAVMIRLMSSHAAGQTEAYAFS